MSLVDWERIVKIPAYFKAIPEFPGYVISTKGEVFSEFSGRVLKTSKNNKGYLNVRIKRKDGKTVTIGIHRLLCICFKPIDSDISKLVVNHIDGDKLNNDLENLEWVTYQKNAEHAGKLGLTTKCKPILVVTANTWEVTEFPSIIHCANTLGMSKDRVSYRVKSKGKIIFPENLIYLYKKDKEHFFKNYMKKGYLSTEFGLAKPLYVREVLTGKILFFEKISDFCSQFKLPLPTVSTWLKQRSQPVVPGFLQLKLASDDSPWRNIEDVYEELVLTTNGKPVFVKSRTGEMKIFTSAVDCAKSLSINPTCLSYRLKSNGEIFFSDGNSYAYYTVAKSKGLISQ